MEKLLRPRDVGGAVPFGRGDSDKKAKRLQTMRLDRRELISAALASSLLAGAGTRALAASSAATSIFTLSSVIELARRSAGAAYAPPDETLPPALSDLSYDAYRRIQFLHPQALWAGDDLAFRIEYFHRGGLYKPKVSLFEISQGQVRPLTYHPEQFLYDPPLDAPLKPETGLAGFRVISQNGVDLDEIAAFVGASYFRSLGRGQQYGQSARGLAIGTGNPDGEEFPFFRTFWIEKPAKGQTSLRIYALLDSPSVTGAFSFVITPGSMTLFDVEAVLFPRRTLHDIGIAPLTSMYLFGPANPGRFDDFRNAVHDSDGLQMTTGAGEALWRQLGNPPRLEESAFVDRDPKGFGLMQRETSADAYGDDEAQYESRPGASVRPKGAWGDGAVHLFELPASVEAVDNIVAFWRPAAPLLVGQSYAYRYSLAWGRSEIAPVVPAKVIRTRTGRALNAPGARQFLVDFALPATEITHLTPRLSVSNGIAGPVRLEALAASGQVRAAFLFTPPSLPGGVAQDIDLHLVLLREDRPVTETWIFRWTI